MFTKLVYVFASAALYSQVALGAAVESRSAQDIFTPPVLSPTTGTVWTVNSTQTVTWCVVLGRRLSRDLGLTVSYVALSFAGTPRTRPRPSRAVTSR